MNTLLVITNFPDRPAAEKMARDLVERRLAACVNMLAPCHSVYHWQGAVETADEVPLFIKTTGERYPALQQAILESHPYELPEIIAVPVTHGLGAYLDWVAQQTGGASKPTDVA